MDKLKPCPFCGKSEFFQEYEKYGLSYGYGIGCLNIRCPKHELVIGHAFSKKRAMNKAVEAWNRRADNGNPQD